MVLVTPLMNGTASTATLNNKTKSISWNEKDIYVRIMINNYLIIKID